MPTTDFFLSAEAAVRYDVYRPQVQAALTEWLAAADLPSRYKRAVDVACGTGHSTSPLLRLAEHVDAIDSSAEMIRVAQSKGLPARVGKYDALPARTYDLVSVCMAFHWFDRSNAIECFSEASVPGAVWVVSNFWLQGHESDEGFNHWYRTWYATRFPAPQRVSSVLRPTARENSLKLVAEASGVLRQSFDRRSLIGYLTTQSNVESQLRPGYGYTEAERELDSHLPLVVDAHDFLYGYHYTICRAQA